MDYTKNLKLSKPSYDDDVDVQILNNNMDILDDNVKRNNDKFNEYLPLAGGTMKGDIKVPQEVGIRYDKTTCFKFIMENDLKTLRLEGERISHQTPAGSTFKVDDTGVWYNNKLMVVDNGTGYPSYYNGYCKLSNSLLMQWGYANVGDFDGNIQTVTLHQPYSNNLYSVVATKTNGSNGQMGVIGGEYYTATFSITATNFKLVCDSNDTGAFTFWIAIGQSN